MRRIVIPLVLLLSAGLIAAGPIDDKAKKADPGASPPTVVVQVPAPEPAKWQEFSIKAGQTLTVKTAGKVADWALVEDKAGRLVVDSDGKSATFVPAGLATYHVILKEEGFAFGRLRITVEGGVDPGPTPVPPDPDPQPDPPPAGTVRSFVVVEDTLKPGTWRGDILGSAKITAVYKNRGLTHRLIDVNLEDAEVDAVGRKFLALAKAKVVAGATYPLLWTFDGANFSGRTLSDGIPAPKTEAGFLTALGGDDAPRSMGALRVKALRYNWRKVGDPSVPMIERAKWKEIDYSAYLPPVYDQDGVGQCASSATCTLIETSFKMAGIACPKLSAGDLYSRVNGGRDQGSTLEDNLYEAMVHGVAPASMVPYVWDGRTRNDAATKAARLKYRIAECYLCETFDAMVSATQQGFVCNEAIDWYDNLKPDASGWLPTGGQGGAGGHSLSLIGAKKHVSGVYWGALTRNSWSAAWGLNGNCIIPEQHFHNGYGGFFAIRSVTQVAAGVSRGVPDLLATPRALKLDPAAEAVGPKP